MNKILFSIALASMSLVMLDTLSTYAQQTGISDENRKLFDEIVKEVNQNLENGTTVLTEENGIIFSINGSGAIIATNAPAAMITDQINETRKVLSPIQAPSPVQFDTDGSDQGVPITAPGQIAIDIISSDALADSATPGGWKGAISYDGGSKTISVSGYGRDYFIVDCPSGLIYGITIQKDSEFGYLELYITGSEEDTEFGEHEETYADYGVISITGQCP